MELSYSVGGNVNWYRHHGEQYAAKSLQSCLTLCIPINGGPPGSPVPGILQARTLEWFVISFSNAWKGKVKVWLFVTPWSAAYQAWAICIFWKLNPYQSHHLQIFSPSLFILFLISFPVQNLISLIRSHLLCLFVILTVLFTSVAYNSLMT